MKAACPVSPCDRHVVRLQVGQHAAVTLDERPERLYDVIAYLRALRLPRVARVHRQVGQRVLHGVSLPSSRGRAFTIHPLAASASGWL